MTRMSVVDSVVTFAAEIEVLTVQALVPHKVALLGYSMSVLVDSYLELQAYLATAITNRV